MTEIRRRKSEVRNQITEINRRVAKYAELFLRALRTSVVKPISDLRLLISGLCAMLFALSFPVEAAKDRME